MDQFSGKILFFFFLFLGTDADVSSCEAAVAHPADQRGSGCSDAPLAVVHIKYVPSVQAPQV